MHKCCAGHRLGDSFLATVCCLIALVLLPVANRAEAALRTVYSFQAPEAAAPMAALILGSDGNFYGTTAEGGTAGKGSIYRMTTAGQLTVLHSFQGPDGASPRSSLTRGNDGNFYGVTSLGGSNGYGVVFRITPTGQFTVLHALSDSPAGVAPLGALALGPDGNFYGTMSSGGSGAAGGLFRVAPSGSFEPLRSLNILDGTIPKAGLLLASDGNFYGITSSAGGSNPMMSTATGTVFKLTPSGQFSVLYVFEDAVNGANASAALIEGSDGHLYGTATNGGGENVGTVFKLTKAGALTVLHSFESKTGACPMAALVEGESGVFYGTTAAGGQNGDAAGSVSPYGTVFKITATGQYTVLHRFNGADGSASQASLVRAADGKFYGTTAGALGAPGTIFRIGSDGSFASLAGFGHSDGEAPTGALLQDAAGNLLGLTRAGGDAGAGVIFKLTLQGQFSVLKSFGDAYGGIPLEGLTKGADGSHYGTTSSGSEGGHGAIFRLSDAGSLSVVHAFNGGDGSIPGAALVLGPDNALYGSTASGGSGHGTLFRVSASGSFSTLHVFNDSDGAMPYGRMVFGADGALYGATALGGLGYGTLFRLTSTGSFTTLYPFPADALGFFPNGAYPVSGLTAAPDGNFYGATTEGVIYRATPSGAVTTIRRLNGNEGIEVRAPLLLGSDGNLYGTAPFGGTITPGTLESFGTIFRVALDGGLTVLHTFSGGDGKEPDSGLFQAGNGMFYGVTARGGGAGAGTVYEIPGPPLIPSDLAANAGNALVNLSWQPAGGAQSYNIFVRRSSQNDDGATVIRGVTASSASVPGLNNGELYYFRVAAVNTTGQSLKSAEVSATPVSMAAGADSGGGGVASPVLIWPLLFIAWLRRVMKGYRGQTPMALP